MGLRRPHVLLSLALVALVGAAAADAAIPNSSTKVISACYATSNGALRVIDRQAGATCTASERLLEFNQRGIRWRGAYSATATYAVNDVVSFAGSSYIAKLAPPAGTAPSVVKYWDVMAAKGTPGLTGGRTTTGTDAGYALNCADHQLASVSVTLPANARLWVRGVASYYADSNNRGNAGARLDINDSS